MDICLFDNQNKELMLANLFGHYKDTSLPKVLSDWLNKKING